MKLMTEAVVKFGTSVFVLTDKETVLAAYLLTVALFLCLL
jgi:hypothetical protein